MDFKIDIANKENSFLRIAEELMNHHVIKVKEVLYRIVDCEFYLKHETHEDNYVHDHMEQAKTGSWYFHGSGIDITIGNREQNSRGGILIRGIAKISEKENANGDLIEVNKKSLGPLNVLTTLFAHFENVFDKTNSFFLQEINLPKKEIYNFVRKGLNEAKDTNGFHYKPYRFISFPYLGHSEKGMIQEYVQKQRKISEADVKELFTLKYKKLGKLVD